MKIDYLLMTELVDAFCNLEKNHKWSLSCGEIAKLLEVFYPAFLDTPPQTRQELDFVFERAYVNTWGKDHECKKTLPEEMKTLIYCVSQSLHNRGCLAIEYLEQLELSN